jgi:ABC-2 type transport system ATP-binding protein
MRQKLGLACALIHEPEVLLLDEPTTGVDPVSRGEFWELLLSLSARGVTILTSTPYMDEAERCARVGLMYEGRLLAEGTPQQVRAGAGLDLIQVTCEPLLRARSIVQRMPGVKWAEVFGDRLHVAVASAREAEAQLRQALAEAGISVTSMRPIAPGMEDAFFELVRQQREAWG